MKLDDSGGVQEWVLADGRPVDPAKPGHLCWILGCLEPACGRGPYCAGCRTEPS